MAKHRKDKPSLRGFIHHLKIQKYYLLNQWHYFKKPKLKKSWEDLTVKIQKTVHK